MRGTRAIGKTPPPGLARGGAGFTLVELLISVAVSSIIIVGAAAMLANMGRSSAGEQVEQRTKENAKTALSLLAQDIRHAGYGVPVELPVQRSVDLTGNSADFDRMYNLSIDNVNRTNGADELLLGGIGMDLTPAGTQAHFILDGPSPNTFRIPRVDGFGNGFLMRPEVASGDVALYVTVVDPQKGWQSGDEAVVVDTVSPMTNPDVIEVEAESSVSAEQGDYAYFMLGPASSAPGAMQTVRWRLAGDTLFREFQNNPPGTPVTYPVLDEVVDFQVAYLVWRCNTGGPQWIHDLTDEFKNNAGGYRAGGGVVARANRFMAMRERLMAIRVSMLIRQPVERYQPNEPWFAAPSDQTYVLEDHSNDNIDRHFRYLVVEQVIDPINLRLKTGTAGTQLYPRILNSALDQKTVSGGTCDARAS